VRFVDSHAPFSLATTPVARHPSPERQDNFAAVVPHPYLDAGPRLRCAAFLGVHQKRGAREPMRPPRVEEMRLSDDGEISIRGCGAFRSRQPGSKAAASHRSANASDLSSILPDGVAEDVVEQTSGCRQVPSSAALVGRDLARVGGPQPRIGRIDQHRPRPSVPHPWP